MRRALVASSHWCDPGFAGHVCHGVFKPASAVISLNFDLPDDKTITYTYRIMDPHTIAVCVVEVDSEHTPTIQYGHMCRIVPQIDGTGDAETSEDARPSG